MCHLSTKPNVNGDGLTKKLHIWRLKINFYFFWDEIVDAWPFQEKKNKGLPRNTNRDFEFSGEPHVNVEDVRNLLHVYIVW